MYEIIRHAAIELNSLDGKQTVKVAGIARRLKNVFKRLFNDQYADSVDKIQGESALIQSLSVQLNEQIDELLAAIKDGDVESYDSTLQVVRELSVRLTKEIRDFQRAAKASRKDVVEESQKSPESDSKPDAPGPAEVPLESTSPIEEKNDYGAESWKNPQIRERINAQYKDLISNYLELANKDPKAILGNRTIKFSKATSDHLLEKMIDKSKLATKLPESQISAVLTDHWDYVLQQVSDAVVNGQIINVTAPSPRKQGERRKMGELWITVKSRPFTVVVSEGAKVSFELVGILLDAAYTANGTKDLVYGMTRTVNVVQTFHDLLDPTKVQASRKVQLRKLALQSAQQQPYQIMPITELGLAKALASGYAKVFGTAPSLEVLGAAWAQAVFERHPSLGLPNYNIGNIKATDDWIKSGRSYFDRSTVEHDRKTNTQYKSPAKWRAYPTAADGAAGYWQLLGNKFQDAMEWMAAGNPVNASVVMGKKGYYTADIGEYSSNVGKIYKTFLNKIAPELPMIKSSPTAPPSQKPGMQMQSQKPQDNSADELINVLLAGPIDRMVKKAILAERLPQSQCKIDVTSATSFGAGLSFAKAASKVLTEMLDADVTIAHDVNKIELVCKASGSQYNVASAITALCDCVNYAMTKKSHGRYSVVFEINS
jgi:hypothetical protein